MKGRTAIRVIGLLSLVMVFWPGAQAVAKDFKGFEGQHIEYPAWFIKDPFFDLKRALQDAGAHGKKGLMVLFTTEGCSYCDYFIHKSLGDPAIAAKVRGNFVSIGLEIFNDADMVDPRGTTLPIKEFAKKQGAGFSPSLVFFGLDGERVLRVIGYQSPERFTAILAYVAEERYRTASLAEYFASMPGSKSSQSGYVLKSDALFSKPPHALDRSRLAADRPLMVLFEKSGCDECREFHADVLALPEVRDLLQRFEIVRLDAADDKTAVLMPNGEKATPASWFKQTTFARVPALLFFDEKGKEVLRTDALVKRQRMLNSAGFVLDRAYEKDWTYQRYSRSKSIERNLSGQ